MTASKRSTGLMVALAATVAATVWLALQPDDAVPVVAAVSPSTRAPAAASDLASTAVVADDVAQGSPRPGAKARPRAQPVVQPNVQPNVQPGTWQARAKGAAPVRATGALEPGTLRGPWPELPAKALAAWSGPPPPMVVAPPAASGPPPKPPAPPFPYTWLGQLTDEAGPVALLDGPQRSFGVRPGEVLDGTWRVERIVAGRIELTWLPGGDAVSVVTSR